MNLTFVFITIILTLSLLNYFIENWFNKNEIVKLKEEIVKLKEENRDKTIELYFLRKIFELKSNPELKYISVDDKSFKHSYTSTFLPHVYEIVDRLLKDEGILQK